MTPVGYLWFWCFKWEGKKLKFTPEIEHSPWRMMVGRLLSFWESLCLWAMLNVWGVYTIHVNKRHVLCFSRYKLHRQICDARPCFAENEWHKKKCKIYLATGNPFLSTPLKTNLELRNWWFVDILRYSFLFHNACSGSMLVFRGIPFFEVVHICCTWHALGSSCSRNKHVVAGKRAPGAKKALMPQS